MTDRTLAPGTYVRFKANPFRLRDRTAVVIEDYGELVAVRTQGADKAHCARHEIAVLRNQTGREIRPMRRVLPYGKWTCADGRVVLFNRRYTPILQRHPGRIAESADPEERVPFVQEEWFYSDSNPPWRNADTERRCDQVLADWGVPPPRS